MAWHPSESELALAASGDLSRWRRSRIERHLLECPECAAECEAFQRSTMHLRSLAAEAAEPPYLAPRILARAMGAQRIAAPRWSFVSAAALPALAAIALFVVGGRTPEPRATTPPSPRAAVRLEPSDAVVEEIVRPEGRQRVKLYRGGQRGFTEVSAATGVMSISHADPATGAVTITRISLGE